MSDFDAKNETVNNADDIEIENILGEDEEPQEIEAPKREKPSKKLPKALAFIKSNISDGVIDRPMFIIILLLLAFGSIMVFSASYAYAYSRFGDSAYYIKNQLGYVALGIVVMLLVSKVSYTLIRTLSPLAYAGAGFLLVLVLVIGMAAGVAQRWIFIGGISVQPSEVAKLAIILVMAWYGERFAVRINKDNDHKKAFLWGILFPAFIIGAVCVLVLAENHLSGTIIIFCIGIVCMWAMGAERKWFIILGVGAGVIVATVLFIVWFKDARWNKLDDIIPSYVIKRIDMWLRPENYTVLDDTWQTVQGTIAVGSGGFFGAGFGESFQKHLFVSQPQNDFIFAIICEELGFVGAAGLIVLYIAFIYRGLVIAKNANDIYSSIVAIGIVGHVGLQALLNMLVVTAVLPNTGISLPFISYGGSSLVMLMVEMGVLLSVSRKAKIDK